MVRQVRRAFNPLDPFRRVHPAEGENRMSAELIQEIARRIREELGITGVNPFAMTDDMNEASREIFRIVAGDISVFPATA